MAAAFFAPDASDGRRASVAPEEQGSSSTRGLVLHVLTSNQRRGAESFAHILVGELQRLGWENESVALTPAASPPTLPVLALGNRRALNPRTLRRLGAQMARADVVVAHGSRTLPAAVLARGLHQVPIVYVNIGDPRYWAGAGFRHVRVRQLLRHVQAVTAITPSSAAILEESFGVPAWKLHVITNARSATTFRVGSDAERQEARSRLGLPAGDVVLSMVGALSPEKRVDVAIDALGRLPASWRLAVAGDGALRAELESHAERAAPGRVHFLGQVEDPTLVYHATDVLALTSDTEGLPGVLIEAGMCGVPVVASDVGFVSDAVKDGRTGLLVPPGQPDAVAAAARRLLADSGNMGAEARRHCRETFSLEVIVSRWDTLLQRMTPDRRKNTEAGCL